MSTIEQAPGEASDKAFPSAHVGEEYLDVGVFVAWIEEHRIPRYHREAIAQGKTGKAIDNYISHGLLSEMGWSGRDADTRALHRWRAGEQQFAKRSIIEGGLDYAGIRIEEVYPELALDIEIEPEGFCGRCHEMVTPIEGLCPWCDTPTGEGRARVWCPREDRAVYAAKNDLCWRCGTKTEQIPLEACECGCGQLRSRFDGQGRRARFMVGHGSAPPRDEGMVDAAPFRAYLKDALTKLDVLGAIGRTHGIARDDVVRILNGSEEEVPRLMVRKALWHGARTGTGGKGAPARPDATGFFDLYPDDARSRKCPECGESKAPSAEMCKPCRKAKTREEGATSRRRPSALASIPGLMDECHRLYDSGLSLREVARKLVDRTPYKTRASMEVQLRTEFRSRGWLRVQTKTTERKAA